MGESWGCGGDEWWVGSWGGVAGRLLKRLMTKLDLFIDGKVSVVLDSYVSTTVTRTKRDGGWMVIEREMKTGEDTSRFVSKS